MAGEERILKGSPDIPLRTLARRMLSQEEDHRIVKAVQEFVSFNFYAALYPESRDANLARAQRKAHNLGLSHDQVSRSVALASDVYRVYQELEANLDAPEGLSPQAYQVWVAKRVEEQDRERRERVTRYGQFLTGRFSRLMVLSDHQLMLASVNPTLNFKAVRVYQESDESIRSQMKNRTLTEHEYERRIAQLRRADDTLHLFHGASSVDDLLFKARAAFGRDRFTKGRMGEVNYQEFTNAVQALLRGELLSRAELSQRGLDPDKVMKKARSLLVDYKIDYAETSGVLGVTPRSSWRKGTDPHKFLGDKSGRKNLGYVQGIEDPN